jgi:pimeloyl-ACP methyl ester carboxylesterase
MRGVHELALAALLMAGCCRRYTDSDGSCVDYEPPPAAGGMYGFGGAGSSPVGFGGTGGLVGTGGTGATGTGGSPFDASADASVDASVDASAGDAGPLSDSSVADAGDGSVPPFEPVVTWTACPTIGGAPPILFPPPSQCALIDVPLRWSSPAGPKIQVFLKRFLRLGATRQVFVLQGGPGYSVLGLEQYVQNLADRGNADVYLFEHRGIGLSRPRLHCPDQESLDGPARYQITAAEMPGCLARLETEFGDTLSAYSTTAAARDLGNIARRLREPGKRLFVWGSSYGTYLAHRYLQIFPADADGVVLDSIVPPEAPNQGGIPVDYENGVDAVGRKLLEACAADALCKTKLGDSPVAATAALLASLENGHCPDLTTGGLTPATFRQLLTALTSTPQYRTYAPALVYRAARCAPGDVTVVKKLSSLLTTTPPRSDFVSLYASWALALNITRSEMSVDPGPTEAAFRELQRGHLFSVLDAEAVAGIYAYPHRYAPDEYVGKVATTATPLLMLSGTLDLFTPVAESEKLTRPFTGPFQHWVVVERAAHGVLAGSPLASNPADTCGWVLFEQFLRDPKGNLDTACKTQTAPLDFAGNPLGNIAFLGVPDAYEN